MNRKEKIARMVRAAGTDKIVNSVSPNNSSRCWCPMCDKENQETKIIAPWLSPTGKVVCVYGACGPCGDVMQATPPRLQSKLADQVEQRLLARFPELYELLPKGYGATPSQES